MTAARKPTVNTAWLEQAAADLERQAEESMAAWIILGQSGRYSENLGKAAVLRRAAEFKNIGQRREYLRNNGIEA